MQYAVEMVNACAAYRRKAALRDLSLRIAAGELVGIFGGNGAGKTTLLKTLNGLVPVQSGSVRVFDQPVSGAAVRRIRTETAYVPQIVAVDARLPVTAWDVTLMARYGKIGMLRRPKQTDCDAARRALAEVGALHLAGRPFGQLSGGEQQRIYIARALAQEPRLLLLDEPTNSLDYAFTRQLSRLIEKIHHEHRLTTVIVSHDAAFLAGLCERIILLQKGKISGERSAAALAQLVSSRSLLAAALEGEAEQ